MGGLNALLRSRALIMTTSNITLPVMEKIWYVLVGGRGRKGGKGGLRDRGEREGRVREV